MKTFKIIVVGDSNVGKTSLTYRFCEQKFLESSEATIGVDFRERVIEIENEKIRLQFWDTAGQERFRKSMVDHYYRNAHAVVIVYDVTKKSSFDNIPQWVEECEAHNLGSDVPRILIGNKCDCLDSYCVSTNTALLLADKYNMPLFETSAKADKNLDNVESIFLTLAYKIRSHKPFMPAHLLKSMSSNENTLNDASQISSGCII